MTEYSLINPPFRLKFDELSKKELREYNQWFQTILPHRINELSKAVRASRDFEGWRPDSTPASLNDLGRWFASQVQTSPRTQEEVGEIAARSRFPVVTWELTTRTISLAMDVSMYLSQVLIQNSKALKWHQPLTAKRSIDYGQPQLVGFGSGGALNPVRIVLALAYGIVNKSRSGDGLRKIYDAWAEIGESFKTEVHP